MAVTITGTVDDAAIQRWVEQAVVRTRAAATEAAQQTAAEWRAEVERDWPVKTGASKRAIRVDVIDEGDAVRVRLSGDRTVAPHFYLVRKRGGGENRWKTEVYPTQTITAKRYLQLIRNRVRNG